MPADADREELAAVAEHISATERRATAAERTALERYRAIILARSIGSIFTGRISGVAEFGLFVTAAENGANGLVPISTLPTDYYEYDERAHRLIGRRSARVFQIGDEVSVRLVQADVISGRLVFRLQEDAPPPSFRDRGGTRTDANLRSPARARSGRRR
jgi:ribonuclease R